MCWNNSAGCRTMRGQRALLNYEPTEESNQRKTKEAAGEGWGSQWWGEKCDWATWRCINGSLKVSAHINSCTFLYNHTGSHWDGKQSGGDPQLKIDYRWTDYHNKERRSNKVSAWACVGTKRWQGGRFLDFITYYFNLYEQSTDIIMSSKSFESQSFCDKFAGVRGTIGR